MKVILKENVVKLGKIGDVVEAAPGYFRNYLEPRKLAILATPGALKNREQELEILKKKAEALHQENLALNDKIIALGPITISAKVGEEGKLYGKVTNKEIAESLNKALGSGIDKRLIKTKEDITSIGSYQAAIKLSSEVHSEITVQVIPDGSTSS